MPRSPHDVARLHREFVEKEAGRVADAIDDRMIREFDGTEYWCPAPTEEYEEAVFDDIESSVFSLFARRGWACVREMNQVAADGDDPAEQVIWTFRPRQLESKAARKPDAAAANGAPADTVKPTEAAQPA